MTDLNTSEFVIYTHSSSSCEILFGATLLLPYRTQDLVAHQPLGRDHTKKYCSPMSSKRDRAETAAARDVSQDLRSRIARHLEMKAEQLEKASTDRHVELIKDDANELTIVRSVADQHQAIVRRIAKEIHDPRSSIDDYRQFGEQFATTAIERRLSLRDAIDGLLFLKTEIVRELADEGFLKEMDGMELKGLIDFIGTRIDVLFAELAVSYHRNFANRIEEELAYREKQNRQKDLFIRIASHEIRNPLSSALLLCEITALDVELQSGSGGTPKEKFAEIQAHLLSISRHLAQLLEMSLLEDDRLALQTEKIDIVSLVQRSKLSFERLRKDRFVSFDHSEPIAVETDPNRVDQIHSNLLHNAAKYSPAGTSIELSVTRLDSTIEISVTDHGDGIKEEEFERIFDPYARLAKDKNRVEGLGLGLYIGRTLAHALGGTLTVKSTLGFGSTFTLTLPLKHTRSSGGTI